MSPTGSHPGKGLARPWLRRVPPRLGVPTGPVSGLVRLQQLLLQQLLLLLLVSLLPSARPASPFPREEEIVFPEKLNGSVLPDSGVPARLWYRLRAFGETLLLELEQDPGVRVEGLTVQYLGQAPELLGGAEPGTYLTGTVNGDPESVASLHWDGGALLGVLQYRGAELHLQPLEGGNPNSAGGPGAHILRRKSPASGQGPMCNVKAPPRSPSPSPRRAKRFASLSRFVETLVVADDKMAAFHGAGLKRYLLTVMAAAAKAFKHPSIRNPVSLVVTRLVILGSGEEGPQVGPSAAQTLRSFCAWQRGLNTPEDSDPDHFDTAILFTRQDLCGVSTCDTLGMADVGTVCDPARSCAVVEDDGLQSAFTAAHELGHVFNMLHDNSKPCASLNGPGSTSRHVMAPVMAHVDPEEPWSPCSARFITDFLDNGYGHCLLDKPEAPLHLPVTFPGKDYDADRQCQLTFGPDSHHCPQLPPPCVALWCSGHLNGHAMCQTKHSPWADGTPCGPAQACMGGRCLHVDQLQDFNTPQAGGWGPWGPWGDCSRTCGGGVQFSSRDCTRPVPRNGGKYCEGRRTRFRSCRPEDCPTGSALTFREQQCAAYNHRTDLFKSFPGPMDWVPRYTGVAPRDQCKLTCQARALGYYYVLEPRVVDGTPCSPDSSSVCVQGRCIHAGCDRVIGSKKKFDKCMVCGTDTTTWSLSLLGPPTFLSGRGAPAGLRSLYLALKLPDGSYALNGEYTLMPSPTDVVLPGAVSLRYSGATAASETLSGHGPLAQPLTLQVLVAGNPQNARLRYSFFVPRPTPPTPRPTHQAWLDPGDPPAAVLGRQEITSLSRLSFLGTRASNLAGRRRGLCSCLVLRCPPLPSCAGWPCPGVLPWEAAMVRGWKGLEDSLLSKLPPLPCGS
ncbi:A disintegrin and metalloproteinase with thrombospondin motifs 4 [Tupaia chinensis]|uniref:A disintegrin and metalloproteinase with thrombospondin motifs 4 n=1 Tax=Tupaia chinensis TaxID=246437 RepID=L8YE67_TUPCH|nr:A disintegrin and metalloproteinase with thrombospondin motifs 4 [Tupaia chinensis]